MYSVKKIKIFIKYHDTIVYILYDAKVTVIMLICLTKKSLVHYKLKLCRKIKQCEEDHYYLDRLLIYCLTFVTHISCPSYYTAPFTLPCCLITSTAHLTVDVAFVFTVFTKVPTMAFYKKIREIFQASSSLLLHVSPYS